MRFTAFRKENRSVIGLVDQEQIYDLSTQDALFGSDLLPLLPYGPELEDRVAQAVKGARTYLRTEVQPSLPIARPGKVLCLGLNYPDRVKEGRFEAPEYPAVFLRATTSLSSDPSEILLPSCSEQLDYEGELMVVVGRAGRNISTASALDHVFGFTVFNDGTVRDYLRKSRQSTPGKNFDGTGPIAADVVTKNEIPVGAMGLRIQSRLNGEVVQDGNTADMIFSVKETIHLLSQFCTLEAGDLIAMGTPPGVGHAKSPPRWLKAGDVVEVEVERIGCLRSCVVPEGERACSLRSP